MTTTPRPLILPSSHAWFFHRWHGERRLGLLDPARFAPGEAFVDCGRAEAVYLLGTGGLDAERLADLAKVGKPMPGKPKFDVPVARPSKILCLGKNFVAHAEEFDETVPEEPLVFNKLPETLIPHQDRIVIPHWLDSRVDHEVELAVVLGFHDPDRLGRKNVDEDEAMDLVAGYSVINDITARTIQGEDRNEKKPWMRAKNFDTFCPMGPWVVAKDDLPNVYELEIRLRVNEEIRQRNTLGNMVVKIAPAIAYLSRHTTLRPGDVIAMGTPEGVGPLVDGDSVRATIESLGQLASTVVKEREPSRVGGHVRV